MEVKNIMNASFSFELKNPLTLKRRCALDECFNFLCLVDF